MIQFCPRCRAVIHPGSLMSAIEVCGDALRRLDADVTMGPDYQLEDWATLTKLERKRWCRKAERAMVDGGDS